MPCRRCSTAHGDRGWRDPAVHDALDLCLACKGCASDCPTGVDMATYKAEVLHQTYRRRLRPRSHYALGMLPRWARATQPFARLANAATGLGPLARLAKAAAGVDQRRSLPAFADDPPALGRVTAHHGRTRRRAAGPSGAVDVVLWADSFTDSFAADAGRAAARVLRDAGQRVVVLDEPRAAA